MKLHAFVPPYSDTNRNLPSGESPIPFGLLMPPAASRGRGNFSVCVGHIITSPAPVSVKYIQPAFETTRSLGVTSVAITVTFFDPGSIATIAFFSSRGPPTDPWDAAYKRPSEPNFIPLIFGLPSNHTVAFPSAPTLYNLACPRSLK